MLESPHEIWVERNSRPSDLSASGIPFPETRTLKLRSVESAPNVIDRPWVRTLQGNIHELAPDASAGIGILPQSTDIWTSTPTLVRELPPQRTRGNAFTRYLRCSPRPHHPHKGVEQCRRIMRAWTRLRVILDREHRLVHQTKTRHRSVIQVNMGNLGATGNQ